MTWEPMAKSPAHISPQEAQTGLIAGIIAYTLWGLFPIYFVATASVSALEILAHRIVWSVAFGAFIIFARKQWPDVWKALKTRKVLGLLTIGAIAMAANWGVYIWAVQNGQIFQGSLGYYINPLMYVLVGVVFFDERLSRLQGLAVVCAVIGVLILTFFGGVIPYIALFLATSFTIYGVVRKQVEVGAMPGLFIETLLLLPVALLYLSWLAQTGALAFGTESPQLTLLLALAGPVTVLPLLAFALAAKRLRLSTLGFLQFIGPTLQFICGLYYGEIFTLAHAGCFGLIWFAVALFSWDALRHKPEGS